MAIDIIARGMAGQAGAGVDMLTQVMENTYRAMFTFKGRVEKYSNLPAGDNSIGDMWYVINDEGAHLEGAYVWEYDADTNTAKWNYLGPVTNFEFDDEPTEGSLNAVTSDGIKKYVDDHAGGEGAINNIRIEGETSDLPIVSKRVTIPLATDERAGLVKLSDMPVGEVDGTTTPVVITDLDSGVYKIDGDYRLTDGTTIETSSPDTMFCVDKGTTETTITVISSDGITVYSVPTTGPIEEDQYVTYN